MGNVHIHMYITYINVSKHTMYAYTPRFSTSMGGEFEIFSGSSSNI